MVTRSKNNKENKEQIKKPSLLEEDKWLWEEFIPNPLK